MGSDTSRTENPRRPLLDDEAKVFIVWLSDNSYGQLQTCTISYHGGSVRTYTKDRYDPRLTLGRDEKLPYFRDARQALEYMTKHKGLDGMCQVDTAVSEDLGYRRSELAD